MPRDDFYASLHGGADRSGGREPDDGVLREIAPDLWIAEEPLRYLGFEVGRRMAVVRLADGGLLIHSPVELSDRLKAELDRLGELRFVVPASILHGHLYMEQYQEAYPQAALFKVPGLDRKRPEDRSLAPAHPRAVDACFHYYDRSFPWGTSGLTPTRSAISSHFQ